MAIDPGQVTAVLLADRWHELDPKAKTGFEFAPFCFSGRGEAVASEEGFILVEQAGARQGQTIIAGPLSSILAVRYKTEGPTSTTP